MADSSDHPLSDADREIMEATSRALRKHGYADLTIKHIAEEFGKSTAAIHYHYDTKNELFASYLDYLLDEFIAEIRSIDTTHPEERLNIILDHLLVADEDHKELLIAVLDMRSQVPFKVAFAERFQQNDEYTRYMLKSAISHGIDEGVFSDVDADTAARSLMTIIDGARTRSVVLDDVEELERARELAAEYVQEILLP